MELKNKRAKRFISIILSVAMVFCGLTLSTSNASALTSGNFTYTVNTDKTTVTITGYKDTASKSVVIPSKIDGKPVTAIGDSAFKDKSITSVTIPEGVKTIGISAFENDKLTSVTIPSTVTIIDVSAFDTNELTSVTIPRSVTTINYGAFKQNDLTSVIIQDGVKTIGEVAFYLNSLTSVVLPSSVETIGKNAFACNKLTSLTMQEGVKTIDSFAFADNQLTSVTIPSSVETIGILAFNSQRDESTKGTLKEVTILSKNVEIGDENYDVFSKSMTDDFKMYGYEESTAEAYAKAVSVSIFVAKDSYTFVTLKPWTSVEDLSNQAWTGSKVEANIAVKDDLKTLIKDEDYTVTYENNINPGTATVTVKGKGAYEGYSTIKTFEILAPVLKAPTSVTCSLYGYDDIKASWSSVSGARGYKVYYKRSTASGYTLKGYTTSRSVTLPNLVDGGKYYVKVIPYNTKDGIPYYGTSKVSAGIYTLKKLSTPSVYRYSSSKVTVKWTNISGESGYQISRSTSKTKTGKVYTVKTTTGKSKVISATKGKTYYYKVRAYRIGSSGTVYGPWSYVKSYKLR